MTRPSASILSELRSPSSPASQVAALRALKNEIIGHEQKKEMWIGLGVVAAMSRILSTLRASGKRKHKDANSVSDYPTWIRDRSEEEEARLQAVIIVASLAHGGPAYIPPLTAGSVLPPLLAILNPVDSHPQLVLGSLRALNAIADSLLLEQPHRDTGEDGFVQLLFTDHHLASIVAVLNQTSPALIVQQQLSLAAALITKTCREEVQRTLLAQAGALEALAGKIASFIIATGSPSPRKDNISGWSISPATTKSRLSPILQAIGVIISKSKLRTKQFICAPAFAEVFPGSGVHREIPPHAIPYSGAHVLHYGANGYQPSLLDSPQKETPTQSPNPVPFGGLEKGNNRSSRGYSAALESMRFESTHNFFNGTEAAESPLIAWLVQVVRAENGVTRLMASWVLTILCRMGFANPRREVGLALLLVPLLVRMLDKEFQILNDTPPSYDDSLLQNPELLIMERAPAVLSMLVEDQVQLQQAAVDAGAIKKLSNLLKQTYDPLPSNSTSSLWTPHTLEPVGTSSHDTPSSSKVGMPGISPSAYHVLRMRESVLIALAAMATAKDEYRKAIIDNGVVPFVICSLTPSTKDAHSAVKPNPQASENPTSVLLAACSAARALSRSVNTLRTSLIDAGLAAPLLVLLGHPDVEVQIAATAVVCNLLLEFSPMRETMIDAGILKILCDHAHSTNARLRLNAVWGLKHLVNTAPNPLKVSCLEELGPGWLKQIISNDIEDMSYMLGVRSDRDTGNGVPMAMGTPNAAGEQVDLLNAVEDESDEPPEDMENDDEDEINMIDSIGALSRSESIAIKTIPVSYLDIKRTGTEERKRLTNRYDPQIQASLQARKDDIAVQEQALNFIQNFICGAGSADMVDHLFRELGQDKFFGILTARLLPKVPDLFRRDRKSSENALRHVPPPTEIIKAVCYVIVHIAAASPRHRQLLMSQHELLSLLVPLFSHPNKEIRASCAWLVINLTWVDDQSDRIHCRSRAYELRKLGIYEKLEELEADSELDVRERTKTALYQIRELLR